MARSTAPRASKVPGQGWFLAASCHSQGEGRGPNHGFLRTTLHSAHRGAFANISAVFCPLSPGFGGLRRVLADPHLVFRNPSPLCGAPFSSPVCLFGGRVFGTIGHRVPCLQGSGKPGVQAGQARR